MKILVIGASGHLGQGAVAALRPNHEIITASRSGDVQVDLNDPSSIATMFAKVGKVDAIVSCTGKVPFKPLEEMSRQDFFDGFTDKVMGQVELVLQGVDYINDGGSITLTTGILEREPIKTGSVASLANGALESFVMAAAIELPRGIRINVVSPLVLVEAPGYHPYFPGFVQVTQAECGAAYSKSVDGWNTGQVIRLG